MRTESLLLLLVYLACSSEAKRCSVKNYSLLDVESESDLYCPGEADPQHFTECCGPSWNRQCCPSEGSHRSVRDFNDDDWEDIFDDDDWDEQTECVGNSKASVDDSPQYQAYRSILHRRNVGRFVGIIVGSFVFILVLTIVCCCCLPCCLCSKKRRTNRGVVHGQAAGAVVMQQTHPSQPHSQGAQYPTQQVAAQPQPYFQQAQPGYADLPPPYPGPPQGGYPPQPTPAQGGYPPAPTASQGYPPAGFTTPAQGGYPPQQQVPVEYSNKQPAFNPNMQQ